MDAHKPGQDILIVGAGPTGLTLAIELARREIPFRLIDQRAAPITTSNALGIQARTLEVFEHLGVRDPVVREGHRLHAVHIHARDTVIAHLEFAGLETPYPFILVLPQARTERLLTDRLEQVGGRIERAVELVHVEQTQDSVIASLHHGDGRQETCSAAWLVGCDGAHSAVRHALPAPFAGGEYVETFAFGDVRMTGPLPTDVAQLFFHPDGLLVLLPMGGEGWRVIATVPDDEHAAPPPFDPYMPIVVGGARRGAQEHNSTT